MLDGAEISRTSKTSSKTRAYFSKADSIIGSIMWAGMEGERKYWAWKYIWPVQGLTFSWKYWRTEFRIVENLN